MVFESRRAAGRRLAEDLRAYTGRDAVVVGLTRGEMVVAHALARARQRQVDRVVCLAPTGELIFDAVYSPRPGEVGDADVRQLLEHDASSGPMQITGEDGGSVPVVKRRDPGAHGRPSERAGKHSLIGGTRGWHLPHRRNRER